MPQVWGTDNKIQVEIPQPSFFGRSCGQAYGFFSINVLMERTGALP